MGKVACLLQIEADGSRDACVMTAANGRRLALDLVAGDRLQKETCAWAEASFDTQSIAGVTPSSSECRPFVAVESPT